MVKMLRTAARRGAEAFVDSGDLSRGTAIAFYAITSIGPVLLIIVVIAGLALWEDAAEGALMGKLSNWMGDQAAGFLQSAIGSTANHHSGVRPPSSASSHWSLPPAVCSARCRPR